MISLYYAICQCTHTGSAAVPRAPPRDPYAYTATVHTRAIDGFAHVHGGGTGARDNENFVNQSSRGSNKRGGWHRLNNERWESRPNRNAPVVRSGATRDLYVAFLVVVDIVL